MSYRYLYEAKQNNMEIYKFCDGENIHSFT